MDKFSKFWRIFPIFALLISTSASTAFALTPSPGLLDWGDCRGSAALYPVPDSSVRIPDSLRVVMINHVGRHGARYPASSSHVDRLIDFLSDAQSRNALTPTGWELLDLAYKVKEASDDHWGRLDSIGAAEQEGIARRMFEAYSNLFFSSPVAAESSPVPRCVMSMYEFLHELSVLAPTVELTAVSGPSVSPLLRFFDGNLLYSEFAKSPALKDSIDNFYRQNLSLDPLRRLVNGRLGKAKDDHYKTLMAMYSTLAGLAAMGLDCDVNRFLTPEEYNSLWQAFNLGQYLRHTASSLSDVPAEIARPLLQELIQSTDDFIAGNTHTAILLRFAHAETLMPLLSLMRLPGCYYVGNLDQVATQWQDFRVVPMAANLQLLLLQSPTNRYYILPLLNERPLTPIQPYPAFRSSLPL